MVNQCGLLTDALHILVPSKFVPYWELERTWNWKKAKQQPPKTFVPAPAPTANAWNIRKEPRPMSTPQTRDPVSGDDTIDYSLNALDKIFGVFSGLNAPNRQLQADRVERFRSESDIFAHIDQL